MKFKRAKALISSFFLSALTSTSLLAATQINEDRWFEVEIILFNQLGDKALLKEAFPGQKDNQNPLPKYTRVVDLLTPYLYPEVASLKQLLPQCGDVEALLRQESLTEKVLNTAAIFSLKSIDDIVNTLDDINLLDGTNDNLDVGADADADADNTNNIVMNNDNVVERSTTRFGDHTLTNKNKIDETAQALVPSIVSDLSLDTPLLDYKLTSEQKALVEQAEIAFSPYQFNVRHTLPKKELCALSVQFFRDILPADQLTNFNINSYPIDKLDRTINGIEHPYSKNPYLLSKDSLELTDIVKQLSLSKNFKPLLHLGWREKPQDRNIAIANHIFAGDNLTTHYQKSLQTYQKAMNEGLVNTTMTMNDASNENTIDGSLVNNLSSNQLLPSDLSPDNLSPNNLSTNEEQLNKTKLLQDSIDNILAHISQVSANDEQEIINDLAINKVNTNDNTSRLKVPEQPLQPWFLDGFFKVHLNHYLYITADFNIMNMSLDEQSNLTSSINTEVPELKTIRFEQNRRVISKEIHYFDHPYMGMIVQIRPFNVPEPEVEVEVAAEIDDISSEN